MWDAPDVVTPSPARRDAELLGTPSPLPAVLPKRRRLFQKTSVEAVEIRQPEVEPELPSVNVGLDIEDEDAETIVLTPYLKKRFHNAYYHWWSRKTNFRALSMSQQQKYMSYYHLRKLPVDARKDRIRQFSKAHPHMAPVALAMDAFLTERGLTQSGKAGTSVLLTWNGSWGLLHPAIPQTGAVPLAGSDVSESPPPSSPSPTTADVIATMPLAQADTRGPPSLDPEADMKRVDRCSQKLRGDSRAADLWEEVQRTVQRVRNVAKKAVVGWSLEVCPRTLEATGEVRVHVHIAMVSLSTRIGIAPHSVLFLGEKPSDVSGEICGSQRGRRALAGIAYLVLPKVCTVFSGCSLALFTDLPVAAQSVFNGVQARKIFTNTAHELLCRIPKCIDRNLEQLARFRTEQGNLAVQKVQRWRRGNGHEQRRPWRGFPSVDQWKSQYAFVLDRYQFLVLDGPSQMGKTAFVRSLVGPDEYMEVNLAGGAAIDLRAYRMWQHTLVLFDEGEPRQILEHKKLFQAGPMPCQMQTSTTNCHAYDVYVGGKMIVICSNIWQERLAALSVADAEWLHRNSVYLRVTQPMWQVDTHAMEGEP